MQDHAPIATRKDGSIDTQHYMRIGRRMRSQAAHDLLCGKPAKRPAHRDRFLWGIRAVLTDPKPNA